MIREKKNEITVCINFFPSRESHKTETIEQVTDLLRGYSLEISTGPMGILITGIEGQIFDALQQLFSSISKTGLIVMAATIYSAGSNLSFKQRPIPIQPIGYVENNFELPASSKEMHEVESKIVLQPQFVEGLSGLNPGQRILIMFYFHQSKEYSLIQHPRGDPSRSKRGVFSLRSPHRPNPIGLTEVELMEVKENILLVKSLDAINGTPVLDIKPA